MLTIYGAFDDQILECTNGGFQKTSISLMVLRDPEEKGKLQKLVWDQPKVTEAPVVLIVLADKKGWAEGHPVFEKYVGM